MSLTYNTSFADGTLGLLALASGAAHAVPPVTPLPTPGGGWVVWENCGEADPAGVLLVAPGDANYLYSDSYAQYRIKHREEPLPGMRLWIGAPPTLANECFALSFQASGFRIKLWDGEHFTTTWVYGAPNGDGDMVRVERIGSEVRVQVNGELKATKIDDGLSIPGWHGPGVSHDGAGCSFTDWQCGPLTAFTK